MTWFRKNSSERAQTTKDVSSSEPESDKDSKDAEPNGAAAEDHHGHHHFDFESGLPAVPDEEKGGLRPDGNRIITLEECYDKLGFTFPFFKKWIIISVIAIVQMSMNFNSGVYANAVEGISRHFNVSEQHARSGQASFLIAYAFGCELWAPWSEEFGRWPILQLSLFLVNIWQIPVALAPNIATVMIGRTLGGLSSAGGSVTLGMVADMWEADDQQYAVAFVVLSSVGGSTIGPFFGGMIQQWIPQWQWNMWIQLIFGGVTQIIHFFLVPETRSTIMMDREAKRRRKAAERGEGPKEDLNLYGPNELKKPRISAKDIIRVWTRPFIMFVCEPIVLCLSLLSGFSDALIFTFLEGFQPIFKQWNFSTLDIGLAFGAILIGYVIGYVSFLPWIYRDCKQRKLKPGSVSPERRLFWLLFTAPLETIGLFGFAWTSLGPPKIPWIAPLLFAGCIAVANYAIYMATIDYMVAAYGPYSSSATGGNGLARDFLAGCAAWYATPFYTNIGGRLHLEYASTILGCLAFCVTIPIYVFYAYGPQIRAKSRFAQTLEADKVEHLGRRLSSVQTEEF